MKNLKACKLFTTPFQWGNQYSYHHFNKLKQIKGKTYPEFFSRNSYLDNSYRFSKAPKPAPQTIKAQQTPPPTEKPKEKIEAPSSFFSFFNSGQTNSSATAPPKTPIAASTSQNTNIQVSEKANQDIVHADFDDWNNYFKKTYETVFKGLGVSLIAMFFPIPSIYNGFPIALNLVNMFFYYLARIKPDDDGAQGKFDKYFKTYLVNFFYKNPQSHDFNQKVYFHIGNLIQGMHHPLVNICIAAFTFLNFLPLYFNPEGKARTEELSQKIVGGYIKKVGGFLVFTLGLNFFIVEKHFLPWTFTQYLTTIISPVVLGATLLWLAQRKLYQKGIDHISNASDYFNAILIIQIFIYATLGLEIAKYMWDNYRTIQQGRDSEKIDK